MLGWVKVMVKVRVTVRVTVRICVPVWREHSDLAPAWYSE